MAGQQGPQWSLAEKNILLTEIIKAHSPNTATLLNVIHGMQIQQPDWHNIPLPPGRSLNQCIWAWHELQRTHPQQAAMYGGVNMGMPTPSPMSAPLSSTSKRPWPTESAYPSGREIRPKPQTTTQQTLVENPPKRKRGRKPKAETLAKAVGQTPANMPGPSLQGPVSGPSSFVPATAPVPEPIITSASSSGLSAFPPFEAGARTPMPEVRSQVSRMPISSMITPNVPKSASHSSSSSGKRRRTRSTRSEPGDLTLTTETSGPAQLRDPGDEAESPSARMTGEHPDTPVRAAMMRHRDEMQTESTDALPGARELFQRPSTQ